MIHYFDDEDEFDWDDEDDQEEEFSWDDPVEDEEEEFDWEEEEEEEEDFDWGDEEEENEDDQNFLPDEDDQGGDFLSGLLGGKAEQKEYLILVEDNKKARLDLTKNSKEDHRYVQRYTRKEVDDQLKKDLKYFKDRCKSKIVVKPLLIMDTYPYKKKKSDSDIPRSDGKNVEEDFVLVIGRLPKLRGTEQFKGKPYVLGQIAYLPQGNYDIGFLKRHFAIVIKKKYKVIKKSKIRKLFDPVKNELRTGWPFTVYKEMPRKLL
jgi:hypothetical protein